MATKFKNGIDADSNTIKNVAAPIDNGDAVNKAYADSLFTGYDYEIHVSQIDGNDTTGNGDLLKPVASITKALTLVSSQRKTIIVHPGTYTESPSITTQYTTITGPGLIGGNIVISGTVSTSVGCTIAGIKMTNLTVTTPASTGNVNILNCEVSGTFTKSSNADYAVLRLCDLNAANITGAGLVAIFGGNPNFVTVNNASANVIVKSAVTVSPVLTAGTLSLVDSVVGAAVTNAVTSAASSVITLANCQFLTSALTGVAPVVLNGFYSILNCVYDKPNSTLVALSGTGGTTNSIDYFQYINADKFITQGGTSSQFLKADGSVDSNTYLTGNQTITMSGDVSGSGTTTITNMAIGANKVTSSMLATALNPGGNAAGNLVTIDGTQTLSAKTLTSAKLTSTAGSGPNPVTITSTQTTSGQTITFPEAASGATVAYTTGTQINGTSITLGQNNTGFKTSTTNSLGLTSGGGLTFNSSNTSFDGGTSGVTIGIDTTKVPTISTNASNYTLAFSATNLAANTTLTIPASAGNSGDIVTTAGTQTLTNKSISGGQINSGTVSNTYLPLATTSATGIASFDSGDFAVSSGAVTVKAQGIDLAQLTRSSSANTVLIGNGSSADSTYGSVTSAMITDGTIVAADLSTTISGNTPSSTNRLVDGQTFDNNRNGMLCVPTGSIFTASPGTAFASGIVYGIKITPTRTFSPTLAAIWVTALGGSSSNVTPVIYSADGSAIITNGQAAAINTSTGQSTGVRTASFSSSPTLTAGTSYWMCAFVIGTPNMSSATPQPSLFGTTITTSEGWVYSGQFVVPASITGGASLATTNGIGSYVPLIALRTS